MKNLFIFLAAACGSLATFLIWQSESQRRVPKLAHQLEEAWGDHHTRV